MSETGLLIMLAMVAGFWLVLAKLDSFERKLDEKNEAEDKSRHQ